MKSLLFPLVVSAFGCQPTPEPRSAFVPADQAAWSVARHELAYLREQGPRDPYTQIIRADFHAPGRGHFSARGALAIAPGRALRMILLGPGGRTVLDVWATLDRYQLQVPELGIVERGGTEPPPHLPIEMFREVLIRPGAGRLLAFGMEANQGVFILRDQGRIFELRLGPSGQRFEKHDAQGGESVEWYSNEVRLFAREGDAVRFRRPALGLDLVVQIEELSREPPDPDAFAPPAEEKTP
jgi:hypothetical protein